MSDMTDKEFLQWIYNRLENRYSENPRIDYMSRLKQIVDDMEGETRPLAPIPDGEVRLNREQAIKWVQKRFICHWPYHINNPAPKGWKWVIRRIPYQARSEYLLESLDDELEIIQKDIYS